MSDIIVKFLILAPPILLALTFHEYAHGYIAYRLGDPTAKRLGRLTLNPIKHLDPIGTIVFFLVNFGWAKPIPVDGNYLKNPQKDMIWVALAGPLTNLILAIISAIFAKLILHIAGTLATPFVIDSILSPLYVMAHASIGINLVLCIFNFLPIPPLDGSRIVMGILPAEMARSYASFERYGFLVILLLLVTGILPQIISPVIHFTQGLLR